MIAVVVNAISVLIGSIIGVKIKIKKEYSETVMIALALCVLIMGIQNALLTKNIIITIISLVLGTILGEKINIQEKIKNFSEKTENKFSEKNNNINLQNTNFSQAFMSASLLFCVGSMSVVGSLNAGISGDYQIIFAKSALDFIAAITLASTLGIGVIFSVFVIIIYQGSITLLAGLIAPFLSSELIAEMSAVGGIMLVGMAINILGLSKKEIRLANMLPSIVLPAIIMPLISFLIKL